MAHWTSAASYENNPPLKGYDSFSERLMTGGEQMVGVPVWNGTEWVGRPAFTWNGTDWVPVPP